MTENCSIAGAKLAKSDAEKAQLVKNIFNTPFLLNPRLRYIEMKNLFHHFQAEV